MNLGCMTRGWVPNDTQFLSLPPFHHPMSAGIRSRRRDAPATIPAYLILPILPASLPLVVLGRMNYS